MTKKFFFTLALFATLVLVFAGVASAQEGFVYTNNDIAFGANTVSGFSVGSGGTLTPVIGSPFPTGGTGGFIDNFAANRVKATTVGNFVFASNTLSNNVSVFTVDPTSGTLTLVPGSPFPTGGFAFFGISLAPTTDGSFLMAASDISNNVTVFSIASTGALTTVGLFPLLSSPDGIQTSPDGKFLAVAEVNANQVEMFSIGSGGSLTSLGAFPAGGAGFVAGVDINCSSTLLYGGEANFGMTIVAGESISSTGTLTPVAGSPFTFPLGNNSNVVLLGAKPGTKPVERSKFLFVSNQFSNTIMVFTVGKSGGLSLVAGSPFPMNSGAFFPSGMGTSPDGKFLYVANFDGEVSVFGVGRKGALTEVSGSPFPTGQGFGLLSLTPFPGRSCTP